MDSSFVVGKIAKLKTNEDLPQKEAIL